jgi:hypothetical protein
MNIKGINVNERVPSIASSVELYAWTKYFTGEARNNFRYGAVRPPTPEHNWFPAAISEKTTLIACAKTFPSPEAAAEWLRSAA